MRAALPDLTRAERQLATHVLRNYPVAALGSITALAKAAEVSTPTVVRLVQKLGFKGYPDYQSALRGEVEAMLVSPLAKHARWAGGVPDTHILNRFADAVVANLQATLGQIDHAEFDATAQLLADPARQIYVIGGRITHAHADYFASLMANVRADVTLLSDMSNTWAPALLDVKRGDLLLVFDIRRYENSVLQLVGTGGRAGGRDHSDHRPLGFPGGQSCTAHIGLPYRSTKCVGQHGVDHGAGRNAACRRANPDMGPDRGASGAAGRALRQIAVFPAAPVVSVRVRGNRN